MEDNHRALTSIARLFQRAAWAPIVVLVFHAAVAKTALREPMDFTIHFSGGAAIAFFVFNAIELLPTWFGRLTTFGHHLFSFAMACTVGLFWEFGELASDVFRGTHIQISVHETLRDLIADTCGAVTALTLVFLVRRFRRPACESVAR